jgi:phage FluMu protein Com
MAAEMKADAARKEAAEKLREAAAETCQAWNYRMIGFGGPAQPSPTIAEAIKGGFYYLEVKCRWCRTHSIIDLTAVNEVRRKPDTPIWKLEASLRCRHCSEALRGRRPATNIVRLRKENPSSSNYGIPRTNAECAICTP